jgi:histidinol dehydrogenase
MNIDPIENHRSREGGAMVYPVYSRRSKGLSLGINLFPDVKVCTFDCPYCEVFPFKTDIRFSVDPMAEALRGCIAEARAHSEEVRDICFSGNGEPTISPHFPAALLAAAQIRNETAPSAALVLITNGTGLLNDQTFDLLRRAAGREPVGSMALKLWLKLDAGTEDWYGRMDRSAIPFDRLIAAIKSFAARAPFTLQTMICAINEEPPPAEEAAAWERLVLELAAPGHLTGVQIYGKARPSPADRGPLSEGSGDLRSHASQVPAAILEARAASLRAALNAIGLRGPDGTPILVEVFP